MKTLTILYLALLSYTASAQTILTLETGSTLTADTRNYSLAASIGYASHNDDQANLGLVYKNYGGKQIIGMRLGGIIHFTPRFFVFNYGDTFWNPEEYPKYKEFNGKQIAVPPTSPRLELAAGLGIRFRSVKIMAGVQTDDYNPKRDEMKQGAVIGKVIYNVRLWKER